MSDFIDNEKYESSSLFDTATEEARKAFKETIAYAETMPVRGANNAPDAGVTFVVSGLPALAGIQGTTNKWVRVPVASDDGEFEGGMSLTRFQGHPSKKFWDKPHKLDEVAPAEVLEKMGITVSPTENGECIINTKGLKNGWEVFRASNVAEKACCQLVADKQVFRIVATCEIEDSKYTAKHSLICVRRMQATTIPFPTKRDNSDYGNEGRGFPLNRLQEHLKPKIQNKGKVELIDIASTDIPGKFGVSAKPSSVVRCNIEVNLKVEGPVSIYGTCCSHAL